MIRLLRRGLKVKTVQNHHPLAMKHMTVAGTVVDIAPERNWIVVQSDTLTPCQDADIVSDHEYTSMQRYGRLAAADEFHRVIFGTKYQVAIICKMTKFSKSKKSRNSMAN